MKKAILASVLLLATLQCKKDEKVENTEQQSTTTVQKADSVTSVVPEIKAEPGTDEIKVVPFEDGAELGKTIFTMNDHTVISFDSQKQEGKIVIDGTPYKINKMDFSDNTYHLYGDQLEINAEDGAFGDMVSDCAYGNFAEVLVTLKGKKTVLRNVKVQDCPKY